MDYIFENNYNGECSSGCDSGWTSYLQHSSPDSQTDHYFSAGQLGFSEVNRSKQLLGHEVVMSEEDMSMVSDASSGQAHQYNNLHHEEEEENVTNNNNNNVDNNNICNFYYDFLSATADSSDSSDNTKKSKKEKRRRKVVVQDLQCCSSLLDDTASSTSPCLDFSNNESYSYNRVSSFRSRNMLEENNASEYSQGYSTTQYKVIPGHRVHYDHHHFKSGNNIQMEQNQWF